MDRREFLSISGAGLLAAHLRAQVTVKPNIILVLADDLGYGDLGCYGQRRIATPNIDRLASEGVRFTQAYAGSTVCAPSRCCLETGYHTGHGRVRGNRSPDLHLLPEQPSLAEVLKSAGYRTGLVGKWSLGGAGTTGFPLDKGYDDFLGYFSQTHAHTYYPEHLMDNRTVRMLRGNFVVRDKSEYAHDRFTERALEFLDSSAEQPFFLQCSYTIPHANNQKGSDTGDGMEVPDYGQYANEDWPNPEKGFAAMVSRLDRDVGRIVSKLQELGKDENTLVLFTSDNGPHNEGGHDADFFDSNGPLRGIKRDLYEGGIRVPAIARWPGTITPGRESAYPWAFWDLLPTYADLAGVAAPDGIDGHSIVPTLYGINQRPHEHLYWEFHEGGFDQAVLMGDWKGVRNGPDNPIELYNLADDLAEQNNVASSHADVVRGIDELMTTERTESPYWPTREDA